MLDAIDAHVHVWTNDREHYPRTADQRDFEPQRFTSEDFFLHARPSGVTRAVLIQIRFYGFDNSYMLESIRAHRGVFSGVAVVDSTSPRPDETMKRLARYSVRGFRITPGSSPDTWLDTPGMQAMWRCAAQRRLAMCALVDPDAIPAIDRMCRRHPDTPVVIDHLARIGADGQIRDADTRSLCALAKHRNVTVKVSAFYALGRKTPPYTDLVPMIRRVFEDFGPRRLMWASDSPFQMQNGHSYSASIALIRNELSFISDEDRECLLAKTAESVFFR